MNKTLEDDKNDKKLLRAAVMIYNNLAYETRGCTLKIVKESNLAYLIKSLVDRKLMEGTVDLTWFSILLIYHITQNCILHEKD